MGKTKYKSSKEERNKDKEKSKLKVVCPACEKHIARTIDVICHGVVVYNLNNHGHGPCYTDWNWKDEEEERDGWNESAPIRNGKGFIAFRCRRCQEDFPASMNDTIFEYIKKDYIVQKLTKE